MCLRAEGSGQAQEPVLWRNLSPGVSSQSASPGLLRKGTQGGPDSTRAENSNDQLLPALWGLAPQPGSLQGFTCPSDESLSLSPPSTTPPPPSPPAAQARGQGASSLLRLRLQKEMGVSSRPFEHRGPESSCAHSSPPLALGSRGRPAASLAIVPGALPSFSKNVRRPVGLFNMTLGEQLWGVMYTCEPVPSPKRHFLLFLPEPVSLEGTINSAMLPPAASSKSLQTE